MLAPILLCCVSSDGATHPTDLIACRCTLKVRANASIDDSNRFCSEVTTSKAAACLDFDSFFSRSSRKCRYSCSSRDSFNSTASFGKPAITIGITSRLGKSSTPTSRKSRFNRRTITASSSLRFRTGTPRQNRCESSISSKAAKLLECPLCGVAERNSLCSNRGAISRTVRVSCESTAYLAPLAGAAL